MAVSAPGGLSQVVGTCADQFRTRQAVVVDCHKLSYKIMVPFQNKKVKTQLFNF